MARATRVLHDSMTNGGMIPADLARELTHAGLISIAKERGYRIGWASQKFRKIFDRWPPREVPEPCDPNSVLLWWVKRERIAWARQHFPREEKKPAVEKASGLMKAEDWNVDL